MNGETLLYDALRRAADVLETGRCSGYAAHEALGYLKATAAAYDQQRVIEGHAQIIAETGSDSVLLANVLIKQEVC